MPASLRPFAKAVTPAVLTVIVVLLEWLSSGTFDETEIATAIAGLLSAILAYAVRNGSHGLRRFAKAVAPVLLTVVGVAIHWAVTGEFNRTELVGAVTGLVSASAIWLVPNA